MKKNSETTERNSEVIISGINRFLNEGYIVWSKASLDKLFKGNIDEMRLKKWERLGFIKIVGDENNYIEVISKIKDK